MGVNSMEKQLVMDSQVMIQMIAQFVNIAILIASITFLVIFLSLAYYMLKIIYQDTMKKKSTAKTDEK